MGIAEHFRAGRADRGAALRDAAALGAVAGLRSMTPLAALALKHRLGGDGAGRYALIAGAASEYVGDKLPITPARTSPPALAGRLASGAFAGAKAAGVRGAAVGVGAAGASAFAAQHLRAAIGRRTGLPDPALGVVEDLLAAGAALAVVRARR